MPGCCVPGCHTDTGQLSTYEDSQGNIIKASVHKFPLKDAFLMRAWLRAISRDNFEPNEKSVVCSRHFNESDFVTESTDKKKSRRSKRETLSNKRRRLKSGAVPSIFPHYPSYKASEYQSSGSVTKN